MKKINMVGAVLLSALAAMLPLATAQEAAAAAALQAEDDPPLQTVTVSGVRDPAMMPYEKAYDMLTRIQKVSDGKLDMAIRIVSAQSLQPMPELVISLRGDTLFEKLIVSPAGFLTVPLRQDLLRDKAVFLTNKKKGSVRVEYFFVPKLPKEQLRYGDIAASIAAARRARVELVPWYLRLVVPTMQEMRICYPNNKQEITIASGTAFTRPATTEQKSMLTKETVYCAAFNSDETEAAKDSLMTLPPGWTPLFM